jgi:DNA-binding transcriptional MerR regulator
MAEIAGVSEQTARNYTRTFAELLSPQARGETGPRLFNDEDVQIFCSIASMRRENIPPAEVIERIRRGDIYIDHTTPQQTTQSPPQSPQTALEAPNALLLIQSQIREIKATQATLLRAAALWGALLGSIVTLAAAGFVLWVLYLWG